MVARQSALPGPAVVAVVLSCDGRIGLLRRSARVASDQGLWHCITGYLESGTPLENAMRELNEETGLGVADLVDLRSGPVLSLPEEGGRLWRVHTFAAVTAVRRLRLNWEHVSYRWIPRDQLPGVDGQVPWLGRVVDAVTPVEDAGRRLAMTTAP